MKQFRELLPFLSKRRAAVVVSLMLLAAVLDGVSVGLVLPFLSLLGGSQSSLEQHRLLPVFVGMLDRAGIGFTLASILLLLAAVTFVKTVVRFFADMLAARLVEQLLVALRVGGVETLLGLSPAFYATARTGDLTQTLLDEVEKTGMAVMYTLKLVAQGAMIAAWVLVMAVLSWQLTVMAVLVAAGVTGLVRFRFAYSEHVGREMASAKQALSGRAVELLTGIKVIWLSVTERAEIGRIRRLADGVADATFRFWRNSSIVNLAGENVSTLAILAIVYVSVTRLRMDMATLVAFFYVLSRVLPQVHRINVVRTELRGYAVHAANVLGLFTLTNTPVLEDGTRVAGGLGSGVQFRNVCFEYRPGEPVLRGVTLSIPRGQTVAIAGASGAGKSTLVELIGRFYDPVSGEILLDGAPLREFQRASWRRRLGVVSQDVFLFNDTIAANIAYGTAEPNTLEIEHAARLAHADEFIREFPRGYDTVVGERGLTLSGGQRQRIALARALVRQPELLILDEATSALDAESERLIFDAIECLAGQMTILVIGHRLASLRHADRIYVIDAGEIVESGTHDELLAFGGRYARYCDLQQV